MKTPTKPQEEILFQCASLIGIAILVVIMNAHRHNLRIRHIIIYVIAAYTSWSLGGLDWAIPFIVGFVAYDLLCKNCTPVIDSISSRRIVRPFIPIMILVFIANLTENFSFLFGPFLVAGFFTTSACIVNRFRDTQHKTITEFKCTCITAIISLLLCIPTQGFYTVICLSPVIVATSVLLSIVYKKLPYNPEHTGLQRYKNSTDIGIRGWNLLPAAACRITAYAAVNLDGGFQMIKQVQDEKSKNDFIEFGLQFSPAELKQLPTQGSCFLAYENDKVVARCQVQFSNRKS